MLKFVKSTARVFLDEWELPKEAKQERSRDRQDLPEHDPGTKDTISACMQWLAQAQDRSATQDGGVSRDYSLIKGWSSSYPETTGYIISTMIDYAAFDNNSEMRRRAERMLDWIVSIQFEAGGFQGGRIDSTPVVPVTFNTGQILIGLASGVQEFGDVYRDAMIRAADWLVATIDEDGCWRDFASPFAAHGEKAYDTHVSWGLFEAARLVADKPYAETGLANVEWAIRKQHDNGWVDDCCLDNPMQPLTHTLGYFLRGVLEAYRYSEDDKLLDAATRTADGLLSVITPTGYLPGRLNSDWTPAVDWVCLTGSVQVAHCWLLLNVITGNGKYKQAALDANRYVRRTIRTTGPSEYVGGVKGSFPIDGDYGNYQFLNWAAKFCVDSNLLEYKLASD